MLDALADPEHRSAAFGYYRALTKPWTVPEAYRPWQADAQLDADRPYLYLHGADDGCMHAGYAEHGRRGPRREPAAAPRCASCRTPATSSSSNSPMS